MITELDTLESEMRANGFPQTNITYGREIATDLTKENIAAGRVVLFFPTLDTESEQMTWQKSPLTVLRGTVSAYAKTDKEAVVLLHSVLVALGFKRENGDVGRPPRMPVDFALGVIRVLWINCPGGVRGTAQPAGNVWAADQAVELAFYTP